MKRRRWMAIPGALVAVTLSLAACVATRIELPAAPVGAGSAIAIQTSPVALDPAAALADQIVDIKQ